VSTPHPRREADDQNKELVTSFIAGVCTPGDLKVVDELVAPDFRLHALWYDPASGALAASRGRDETKQLISDWLAGFPDLRITIESAVAEGDRVGVRYTATGTFANDVGPLRATGRSGSTVAMTIARVADGKIVEAWPSLDTLGMLQQLGIAPKPKNPPGDPEDPERERRAGNARPTAAVEAHLVAANRALLTRFWTELWNDNDLEVADAIVHPDFFDHGLVPHPIRYGPEGAKDAVTMFRTAVPDLEFLVDDMVAEGELVMTRWTGKGTQTGALGEIKPTGRHATVVGYTLNRVVDGRVVEAWDSFDQLGMLFQLGVLPPPGSLRARAFSRWMRLRNGLSSNGARRKTANS